MAFGKPRGASVRSQTVGSWDADRHRDRYLRKDGAMIDKFRACRYGKGSRGRSSRILFPAMLQRKQTLFLLLAVACGVLSFFFPVDTFLRGDSTFIFRTTGLVHADGRAVSDGQPPIPFGAVIGVLSAALFVAIFLYGNRRRQVLFVRSAYILLLAVVALLFISDTSITAYLEQGGKVDNSYGASAILPVAMMVFAFLAERGIRKDEALVKSMDRLR